MKIIVLVSYLKPMLKVVQRAIEKQVKKDLVCVYICVYLSTFRTKVGHPALIERKLLDFSESQR